MPIRYHLDENVDHAVARGLQQRGIDVTTSTDVQLVGVSPDIAPNPLTTSEEGQ